MKRQLHKNYPAADVHELPVEKFQGRIITIGSRADARRAVQYLLRQDILGFDTETRPQFHRGAKPNKVSILQVATHGECFIFRLYAAGVAEAVKPLLEDNSVLKVALSWGDDVRSLHSRIDYEPGLFVDIQKLVGKVGIEDLSLQKIYANLFGLKISKKQRLTNWDNPNLQPAQLVYAATDAWACIRIYEELNRLIATGDYEVVDAEEPAEESAADMG